MSKVIPLHRPSNDNFTACINCHYFLNKAEDRTGRSNWYNHLCRAVQLPRKRDSYDGTLKYVNTNSIGEEYFTEDAFQYCRAINDGNCPHFKSLSEEAPPDLDKKDPNPSLTEKVLAILLSFRKKSDP